MERNEAIHKLAKGALISLVYAEDLYDSFFEKPVVQQYVADWYEENNGDLNGALFTMIRLWDEKSRDSDFYRWFRKDKEAFQTLVNMHQFGYEVEKEPKYTVRIKGRLGQYLGKYYLNNEELTPQFTRTQASEGSAFTRTELESSGFGWVFNCPGVEVKEVGDE